MNEKLNEWLRIFLDKVKEEGLANHVEYEEGYKFLSVGTFQRVFDIEAIDLAGNLNEAIYNNNLVAGAMYFPKKMLLIHANNYPEETRSILRNLFDESVDVGERINDTKLAFENLEERRAREHNHEPAKTFIGLRFISLLLGFRFPNTQNALKPSEWKIFCKFIDSDFHIPNKTLAGRQYEIYGKYIEELRTYLKSRPEIEPIREALTHGLSFKDDELRWMTQDVIFVTARIYSESQSEKITTPRQSLRNDSELVDVADDTGAVVEEFNTGFMAYESHLEEYIIQNWERVDFGEPLEIYVDEDGTTGQQYATEVGVLDILATDKNGDFVVIELKRAESGYKVVGQILNYIGWVQANLAHEGQKVRGIIVIGKAHKTLIAAVSPVKDFVQIKEYQISMQISNVASL